MKEYELKKNRTVTVVTQYEKIEQEARKLGARVYYNPHPEEGISSSMKIGLEANLDADACLFTVSDQPWLTLKTIENLTSLLENTGKGLPVFHVRESLEIPVYLQRNIMKNCF